MKQLGQVMMYVMDLEATKEFWLKKVGFVLLGESHEGEFHSYEIAPTKHAQTTIVLFDRALIAKYEPELNLGTPSLMFYTEDADELYDRLKDLGVTVGEKVARNGKTIFNFADNEDNYFAVMNQVG